ncbi:MAG: TraX family protein [Lachnospiraceae bacterium]
MEKHHNPDRTDRDRLKGRSYGKTSGQPLPVPITGSTLKILAAVFMLIDHIGAVIIEHGYLRAYNQRMPGALTYDQIVFLLEIDDVLRFIGRIAFPIFCFLLVEGFIHTKNRKKYAARLLIFALLAEIPFDLAFRHSFLEFTYQNVMFTLLIGLLMLMALEKAADKPILYPVIIALAMCAAYGMHTDYDYKGILFIAVLYLLRYEPLLQTVAGCISLLWEWPACFAFLPIRLYNGQQGLRIKYFFYWFYPVHILVLAGIRWFLCGI